MTDLPQYNPVEAIYAHPDLPDWKTNGVAVLHLLEPVEGVNPIIDVASNRSGLAASMNGLQEGVRAGIHYIVSQGEVPSVA